jgi:hypothetical protein
LLHAPGPSTGSVLLPWPVLPWPVLPWPVLPWPVLPWPVLPWPVLPGRRRGHASAADLIPPNRIRGAPPIIEDERLRGNHPFEGYRGLVTVAGGSWSAERMALG